MAGKKKVSEVSDGQQVNEVAVIEEVGASENMDVQEENIADVIGIGEPDNVDMAEETEEAFTKGETPIEESTLTEKDAASFASQMELGNEFIRRSIALPGRKRRKQVFKEEEPIIGDDNNEIETYESMKQREYEILSDSAKSQKPKVLYGRMIGTEVVQIGETKTVMAVCSLLAVNSADIKTDREIRSAIYKIKIPAPLFFFDYQNRYTEEQAFEDLKYVMDTRVGSIIEFVVYNINMDEDDVLASRINAMQILSYDYYLGKKARIKPGTIAKGRIVFASRNGVMVDVLGADVFISRQELAWKYISNVLDEKEFRVGKAIAVRVSSVETDSAEIFGRNYPFVKIKASAKDARKNPNQLYYDKFEVGQKYIGYIAYHLATGQYIVNLGEDGKGVNNEQPVCICKAPSVQMGGVPYVGQKCSVAIIDKNEKTYQFVGSFTYMEP